MSNLIFEPHSDKQTDFIFSQKNISIAATGIQWGKAINSSTKVLTIDGYKVAKDIVIGDILFDRDGKPTKVTGVFPQGMRECYRIDLTDRKSFIVDENHINIIKRRGYAKEETVTTKDLFKRKSIWEGKSKPQIPSVKPIIMPEKQYLITPYIMGALLGDGGLTKSITLSSIDEELLIRVKNELPVDFKMAKRSSNGQCDYVITSKIKKRDHRGCGYSEMIQELRILGIFGHKSNLKFIPDNYKYGSIEQRVDLLRGLMDTDGTIHNNGSKSSRKMEYFTSSKALAKDVIWLVESLGGKAWINVKKKTFYRDKNNEKIMCRDCHRVNIISPIFNPFYIQRKAEKYFKHKNTTNKLIKHIEPVGKLDAVCFQVDSPTKTFVIEGQVVTHNSSAGVMRLKIAMHEFTHPTDNFIVTSPTYKILYQSTLPVFNYWNKGLGTYDKKNECFNIRGGGTVWFRTGVDPDSVVGITNVRHILCDEAGLYSLYFWENIQARASFKEAHIDIVTSPYSLNWLYRDYIRKHRAGDEYTREQVHLCQAKSCDNPYFPMAEYDKKRRTMEPRRFNMMYGGNFDKAQGLVYGCFDSSKHWIDPINFPEGTKFVAGIDWGYTHPFVIVVRAITPLGMHYQVAEFYRTQLMLNEKIDAAQRMRTMYPIEKFYADPANPDDIASFNQAGLRVVPANNDIKKGIETHWELVNSGCFAMFKGNNFHTADEYEMYHYPEQKDLKPDQSESDHSELPVDKDNHCIAEGTPIFTDKGLVPVEKIKIGDYVRTRSGFNRVSNAWMASESGQILILKTITGKQLQCTLDHKIWTKRGFVKAIDLRYDDVLISIGEKKWKQFVVLSFAGKLVWKLLKPFVYFARQSLPKINTAVSDVVRDHVQEIYVTQKRMPVYDLTVENEHEFFADGVLVSNCMDANRYVTYATFTTSKKPNKIITSENQNIVPSRISSDYDLNRDKLLKRKKSHSRIL